MHAITQSILFIVTGIYKTWITIHYFSKTTPSNEPKLKILSDETMSRDTLSAAVENSNTGSPTGHPRTFSHNVSSCRVGRCHITGRDGGDPMSIVLSIVPKGSSFGQGEASTGSKFLEVVSGALCPLFTPACTLLLQSYSCSYLRWSPAVRQ